MQQGVEKLRVELLVIDPQNDFCVDGAPLCVPGAWDDMERIANMINRIGGKLDDIHVTLDTHHRLDVAHSLMWRDAKGDMPEPLKTVITHQDVDSGVWRPVNPRWLHGVHLDRGGQPIWGLWDYTKALQDNGRYPLVIWPEHCLVSTPGTNVVEPLAKALYDWEGQIAMVDFVLKGSNMWTEHYSAVQADVPDPEDHTTQLNTRLITTLQEVDLILLAGEALNFCVASTVTDIADNFGEDNIKKLCLLEDATNVVPGFDALTDAFMNNLIGRGMQISTTDKILA